MPSVFWISSAFKTASSDDSETSRCNASCCPTAPPRDTIGGACSKESNTLRYGHHTWGQHGCAENFLRELSRYGMGKRDHVSNVNWFMNVPVDLDGALGIVDGISAPGLSLSLRAEKDTLVLVSNCPQVNNPCNGFDPSRAEMVVTAGA